MKKIIFVCSGNTCRSPMAEGLFKQMLKEKNKNDLKVYSAGLAAAQNDPVSENAKAVMLEKGIDIGVHIANPLTKEQIGVADYIVALAKSHYTFLMKYDIPKEKLFLLGNGINDPFGGDIAVYRECRDEIEEALKALYKRILGDV